MQVGDLVECEHCPEDIVTETTEAGARLERRQPTRHPIVGFVPSRTVQQETHVGMKKDKTGVDEPVTELQTVTFNDGRPILDCPSLYRDQVHDSAKMRLVGMTERP